WRAAHRAPRLAHVLRFAGRQRLTVSGPDATLSKLAAPHAGALCLSACAACIPDLLDAARAALQKVQRSNRASGGRPCVRAAVYHRYGPPDVVRIAEVATPPMGDADILIRVMASTVCAPDWRFRAAKPFFVRLIGGLFAPKRKILGMEFAGRVEAVGNNVTRYKVGDDVFGSVGFAGGAHAEYVSTPETN